MAYFDHVAFKLFPRLIHDPYNPMDDGNEEYRDIWIEGAKWQQEQQDTFAIKFGVWLSVNCDQDTSKDGWWLYEKTWLTTDECLLKFKMATLETQYKNWLKENEPIEYSEWLEKFGEIHHLDKVIQIAKKPCDFDHNGECLICDCWPSDCAYQRYISGDYKYETKEELEKMFKDFFN